MTLPSAAAQPDPFADPDTAANPSTGAEHGALEEQDERSPSPVAHLDPAAVLTVDRNATLTLGTDALIILDEGLRHRRRARNCCGLLPQLAKTTRAVPFSHVLWAEMDTYDAVTVQYAQVTGKKACRVAHISYPLSDKTQHAHAHRWIARLLDRAYPAPMQRCRRIKVLVNPFGGQGHAARLWAREVAPIFAAARCIVDVERTAHRGHAAEIAARLDVEAWDVVACASGDGLPHEVFNGLARQARPRHALRRLAVVQLPCGSGNAMSLNLFGTDSPSLAALAVVKGRRTPLDLLAVTQAGERYLSFLSQAVGIVAESDLGTESLRWMGPLRFTWGFLVRLLGKTVYPAEVAVVLESEDKHAIKAAHHAALQSLDASPPLIDTDLDVNLDVEQDTTALPALRYGTVRDPLDPALWTVEDMPGLGNFYAGNMCYMSPDAPFFAAARPGDGLTDLITISGLIPRTAALRLLASVASGTLIDMADVRYRKVRAYRISPRAASSSSSSSAAQDSDDRSGAWLARIVRWLGGRAVTSAGAGDDDHRHHRQQGRLIAIDGERVPFEPFQAEVMPALGTTLSRRRAAYEFQPPWC